MCTYPLDQISSLGAHKRRNRHVGTGDSPLRHNWRILEGSFANEELVRQNAQTPQVNLFVVVVLRRARLDHLGREVIQRAAHGLPPVVGSMDAPAEIRDLDLAVDADQDVLRLDIPVDNMLAVQVSQRGSHLGNVLGGLPLGEAVRAAKMLIQLALAGELQDQKDTLAVVEVAEHLQDARMAQVALDLNLTTDLALDAAVLDLVLVKNLQGADEAAGALPREVHSTKLALAKWLADFKHAQVELLWYAGLLHQDG